MANTLQKKIKFNKGVINQGLQERTDLALFDSSASVIENMEPTMFGGLRTRKGTERVAEILAYSTNEKLSFTATSAIGGSTSALENGITFISGGVENKGQYILIDLGSVKSNFLFQINEIKYIYNSFNGSIEATRTSATSNFPYEITMQGNGSSLSIANEGVAVQTPNVIANNIQSNSLAFNTNSKGAVTGAIGNFVYKFTWTGNKPSYANWNGKRIISIKDNHTPISNNINIETSSDGVTWTIVDTITVDESTKSFQTSITSARYVLLRAQTTTIKSQLTIGSIVCLDSGTNVDVGEIRLIDFVYNNLENYLFVMLKGRIDIYKVNLYGTDFVETVNAPILTDNIVYGIKWTYKDDTIIFTHQDMPPCKLVRLADDNWNWQQISLQNVPKELFGSATVSAKSVSITPDKAEGIVTLTASSAVFDLGYEGQIIDGNGGRVRVTKYISSTKVSGYTIIPFYNTDSFSSWNYESGYEAVWSATKGYPRCCCIANERLFFAGTPTKPNTIWASRVADYFNFKNAGNYDNDSISFTMDTNAVIYDMIFNRGLHIFTSDFEASSPESSFRPSNFKVIPTTKNGINENIRPIVADGQILYIDSKNNLRSYVYNDKINSYESSSLSKLTNLGKYVTGLAIKKGEDNIPTHIYVTRAGDEAYRMKVMYISQEDDITSQVDYYISDNTAIQNVCSVNNKIFTVIRRRGQKNLRYYLEAEERIDFENFLEPNVALRDDLHFIVLNNYVAIDDTMINEEFVYHKNSEGLIYNKFDSTGTAPVEVPAGTYPIGIPIRSKIVGNKIAINGKTNNVKKRISKATLVYRGSKMVFCGQELKKLSNEKCEDYKTLDFYACTLYGKDITYNIESEQGLEILSITLNINYEG